MTDFHEEPVDLRRLARILQREFAERPPVGAIVGRTMMRDALAERTGCSLLEAERWVEQLERLGYLQVTGPRLGSMEPRRSVWRIVAEPLWLH